MLFTPRVRLFWALLLSTLLTNIPALAWAEAAPQMISTAAVVDDLARQENETRVQNFLTRTDVRAEFLKRGVSPDEVAQRISSLSNQELNQLAHQMDQLQYGGDVTGILILVLLVVLIIYLVKRI